MDIKSHKRINDILLAPLEKPLLQWLAARMPSWMFPDALTAIGVLGAVIIFAAYCSTNWDDRFLWLASLGFIINWFGDALDGTLARYRKIQRPKYGFFLDHTVDAFCQLLIVMGLGLSPYFSFSIACMGLIGYFMISILVYIRTCVEGVFQISYAKIGPTEVRLILVGLNTAIYFLGNPQIILPWGQTSPWDLFAATVAIALISTFLISGTKSAIALAQIDPPPVAQNKDNAI